MSVHFFLEFSILVKFQILEGPVNSYRIKSNNEWGFLKYF